MRKFSSIMFSALTELLQILSDQGTNFESDLFKKICRIWSIDKVRTSAYKPSTNGNIDRFYATLNSTIAKWISADHRNCDTHLPAVAFAYRTSVHESAGFTPYFLMFGRESQISADIVYGPPPDDRNKETTVNDFVNIQQNKMQEAFHLVRDSLGKAAEGRKYAYDLQTRSCHLTRGMWVWYFIPRRRVQLNHKWQSVDDGPYLIIRAIGEVNVEIQRTSRAKGLIVHIDKLKLCHMEGLVSWLPTNDVKLSNHASDGIHVPSSPLEPIMFSAPRLGQPTLTTTNSPPPSKSSRDQSKPCSRRHELYKPSQ